MPLARLSIEQLEGSRWVAEVEAGGLGGPLFKHERLNAVSYEDVMAQVSEFYYRQVPPPVVRETHTFTDEVVSVPDPPEPPVPTTVDFVVPDDGAVRVVDSGELETNREPVAPKRRGRPPKVRDTEAE